ncbi:MAG: hypothetical protein EXR62_03195 [Chloroflexi bacterium]|nr:hypothetical protein [Chloroflexota bacterium]
MSDRLPSNNGNSGLLISLVVGLVGMLILSLLGILAYVSFEQPRAAQLATQVAARVATMSISTTPGVVRTGANATTVVALLATQVPLLPATVIAGITVMPPPSPTSGDGFIPPNLVGKSSTASPTIRPTQSPAPETMTVVPLQPSGTPLTLPSPTNPAGLAQAGSSSGQPLVPVVTIVLGTESPASATPTLQAASAPPVSTFIPPLFTGTPPVFPTPSAPAASAPPVSTFIPPLFTGTPPVFPTTTEPIATQVSSAAARQPSLPSPSVPAAKPTAVPLSPTPGGVQPSANMLPTPVGQPTIVANSPVAAPGNSSGGPVLSPTLSVQPTSKQSPTVTSRQATPVATKSLATKSPATTPQLPAASSPIVPATVSAPAQPPVAQVPSQNPVQATPGSSQPATKTPPPASKSPAIALVSGTATTQPSASPTHSPVPQGTTVSSGGNQPVSSPAASPAGSTRPTQTLAAVATAVSPSATQPPLITESLTVTVGQPTSTQQNSPAAAKLEDQTPLVTAASTAPASPTPIAFVPKGELPKTGLGLGSYFLLGGMLALMLIAVRLTRRWVRSQR